MSKLIVNEIEKYDAGQLTITTGTDVSIGSDLTVSGALNATLSTASQPNITSVGTLSSLAVSGNLTVDTNTLYVDSSSNRVGIGTSSPDAYLTVDGTSGAFANTGIKLKRTGSLTGNASFILAGVSGSEALTIAINDSEKVRIDSSGNVGIGTSSPAAKLHTFGTGDVAKFETTSLGGVNFSRESLVGIGSTHYNLSFNNSDSEVAYIKTLNRTGGTTSTGTGYELQLGAAGSGYQTFYTNSAERMRIDSSGNVKIGDANPDITSTLTVSSNGSTNVATFMYDGTAGTYFDIDCEDADGIVVLKADARTGAYPPLSFMTGGSERMRIDSSGNVGIGTSGPSSPLHIKPSIDSIDGGITWESQDGTHEWSIDANNAGQFRIYKGTTAIARFDSSGSVLIGKTSAYASDYKLDIEGSANARLGLEAKNGFSSLVFRNTAGVLFQNVSSTDMSFLTANTERMRIDASGNIIVGGTVAQSATSGRGNVTINGASTSILNFAVSETRKAYLYHNGTDLLLVNNEAGRVTFSTNDTERIAIDSDGRIVMGTTATSSDTRLRIYNNNSGSVPYALRVQSTQYGGTHVIFTGSEGTTGTITYNANTTSYNTSSDYRLKENVVPMEGALDRVDALNPSRFNFIADPEKTVDGFLAHEVSEVIPEAITGEKDAVDEEGNPIYQGIDQSKIVPLLVGAIQELRAEVESLKSQLNA